MTTPVTAEQVVYPSVEFWALPRGGTPVALPHVRDFSLSRVRGQAGTVTLDYPTIGQDFALLAAIDRPNAELEVEIRIGGTSTGARRAMLQLCKGDRAKRGDVWTFSGHYLGKLIDAAQTVYESSDEKGETRFSASPGRIMRILVERAKARGVLTDITVGFTDTHDSRGVAWPSDATITISWSPGTRYLAILEQLEDELEVAEWDLTGDRVLQLYAFGTRGVDRTLPGAQVTLEYGRDILDAPTTGDNQDGGTRVLGAGKDGLYRSATNSTAEAQRGRAIETFQSWNNVEDTGTLQTLVQRAAAIVGDGSHEYAHELTLSEHCPRPGRDFDVSDWVLRSVGGTTERVRVAQHVLSRTGNEIRWTVGLGDMIEDAQVRTRRMIERLLSGAAVVGTSTAPQQAEVDDGKPPAKPTGLNTGSNAYKEGRNNYALVTVGWLPVQKNADGTDASDIARYRVEWRATSGDGGWVLGGETEGTALSFGRVPVNLSIQVRVQCLDKWSRASEWSDLVQLVTTTDTAPPPVPSAPTLFNYIGLIVCEWDGLGSAGERMPLDFDFIEVHCSTTANFTPDRPADMSTSTTFVGLQMGAGQTPYAGATELPIGTNVYFRLVAVDNLGNVSAASAASVLATEAIEDGDIASVNIGKLTTGELKAILTISQAIQTAATGSRVRIDTAGLWCYNAAGTEVLSYRIATGLMRMVGEFIAQGSGTSKIEITPGTQPTMYLHSLNQTVAPAFMNAFAGGSGRTSLGINSGPTDTNGNGNTRYSRVVLTPENGRFQIVDGLQNPRGGTHRVTTTSADSSHYRTDGTLSAAMKLEHTFAELGFWYANGSSLLSRITLFNDGVVMVGTDNNNYLRLTLNGAQLVSNGSVKSFVVDHPSDPDRWLVHGCTESPTAGVEYTGAAVIHDHAAVVELPDYFEGLCEVEGRTVQVTVELPEEPQDTPEVPAVPGPMMSPDQPWPPVPDLLPVPEWADLPRAAASTPRNGRFRIACSGPDGTRVAWHVRAVRRDASFEVEPLRADYVAHGDGPYRYLVPRAA